MVASLRSVAARFPAPSRPKMRTLDLSGRLGHERIVAIAVAAILLGASVVSIVPGSTPKGGTGGPSGDGPAPRLAIGGESSDDWTGDVEEAYVDASIDEIPAEGYLASASNISPARAGEAATGPADAVEASADESAIDGPFLADGTLLKPVVVDTTVADGSDLVRTYKVKPGDTLVGIARAHGVSMMTLWWANKLKNKDDLHQGQVLKIPPVTGLVLKVKTGDTLDALAKKYKVTPDQILETNGIEDTNLVVGQVLILPGAKGAPIPTPKPTKKPTVTRTRSSGSVRPPRTYSGGNFAWPAPGGRISQYYHYGHYGLDIDGSTGDRIIAAASGTVTFAGWKSNGGGYQVWISHGSGLYTTYNHMSSVSVGRGQHVGKGQRVGRMGATGYASGSHLHFEVWKGPIWNGGRRVNPLAYL
jgi:murein DD-endopeptidase MepM/ murein hydrolase activator NlpD